MIALSFSFIAYAAVLLRLQVYCCLFPACSLPIEIAKAPAFAGAFAFTFLSHVSRSSVQLVGDVDRIGLEVIIVSIDVEVDESCR